MSNPSYPHDAIGNPIRRNDLVSVHLPTPDLIFRVADVEPAPDITSPGGEKMPTQGRITLTAVIPMAFASDQRLIAVLVLKQPEEPDGQGPVLTH